MSDNPIHCDCNLANSLQIGKNIQLVGEQALCQTPEELKGRNLNEILPYLCKQGNEEIQPEVPEKKDFDFETKPNSPEPIHPTEPPETNPTESDVQTVPTHEITEEFTETEKVTEKIEGLFKLCLN